MVTLRCTTADRDPECNQCYGGNFGNAMDRHSKTLTSTTINCCMACCYTSGTTAAKRHCKEMAKMTSVNASSSTSSANIDYDEEVPSEATAFVASASAAALVLLVAFLAVILSSVAVLSLASLVPTTAAATDVPGPGSPASDYLHRWHYQHVVKHQQQQPNNWHLQRHRLPQQQQQQFSSLYNGGEKDVLRRKRQLFKNKNREPGIVALTFSLISGTISDGKEAYRNVSNIVRETIKEANKVQSTTTTVPSAESDQMMMAAGNSAENEIAMSSITAAPPVDQKAAGEAVGKLFGRNYRGLRRLFDSELRTALKNSPGNARDFAMELVGSIGQSLRPRNLFSRGPINDNVLTSESRR